MTRGKKRFLVGLVVLIIGVVAAIKIYRRLPSRAVLVLDVGGPIDEQRPVGGQPVAARSATLLHDLTDAIDTARDDSRITGLVVKIAPLGAGWGKVQELRAHLLEFRKSKKPNICYLGEDYSGNREYYLATACDQVWLVPTAALGVTGLLSQSLFVRGTLDRLKIYPDLYHIAEYKTAANLFTEKRYTAAHREMAESLLRSALEQYVSGVAQARHLDRAQLDSLLQRGPYLAAEALSHHFVDRLAYWDEVHKVFEEKNGEWRPVSLSRYLKEVKNDAAAKLAVVHATGTIETGNSGWSLFDGFVMGSDTVAADLRRAREDDDVKAIILRVDSPGGSAVASEIIRREVDLARAKKPVVISMSDVAGSGGYWISMSGSKILAEPTTLTGSIGVVFGKFNLAGLYDLLGLSTDHLTTSENATLFWNQQNFSAAQREQVLRFMQDIYANFTKGVAEGRKMSVEAVDKIGKGRVWTGAQARELGLVDEVGDFSRALAAAKELAKIDAKTKVRLERFPKEAPWWKRWLSQEESQANALQGITSELRRLARAPQSFQVRMPDLAIR